MITLPGGRIRTRINAGLGGKRGGLVQSASDDGGAPNTAMGKLSAQFQVAPFDAVVGHAKGSAHKGAPVASGSNPTLPGEAGLLGHSQVNPTGVSAEAPGPTILPGHHNPVRSKGPSTKPSDIDKLKTAGS